MDNMQLGANNQRWDMLFFLWKNYKQMQEQFGKRPFLDDECWNGWHCDLQTGEAQLGGWEQAGRVKEQQSPVQKVPRKALGTLENLSGVGYSSTLDRDTHKNYNGSSMPGCQSTTTNYISSYQPIVTMFDNSLSLNQPKLTFSAKSQISASPVLHENSQITANKYSRKLTLPSSLDYSERNLQRQAEWLPRTLEAAPLVMNQHHLYHSFSESQIYTHEAKEVEHTPSSIYPPPLQLNSLTNSNTLTHQSSTPNLCIGINHSFTSFSNQDKPAVTKVPLFPSKYDPLDSNRSGDSSKRSSKILFTKTNNVKLFKKKRNISTSSHNSSDSYVQESIPLPNKRSSFFRHAQPKLEDFKKGKLLGKGNFGHVHIVEHIESRFICAMKVVPKQKIRQERIQQQMARELKLHSILKHRNIVEQYGFFCDQQNLYIMVELCPDGQLYNVVKRKKRLSEPTTAFIIRQLCEGLMYLHDSHIIHRDIKPQNIILTNGIVKICDFGWAVNCSTGLRGTRCGTPLYLSPEMIKGEQYDQSVDIWAVGVLTYQLLVGSMPFKIWWEGELNKIVSQQVKFPTYVDLSTDSKDFILKILQKNPTNRIEVEALLHHPFLKNARESSEYFAELTS